MSQHGSIRSQLERLAPAWREPDWERARELARDAWHHEGVVLIRPEWLSGWADRKQAELLAEKLFGKRAA